MTNAVASSRLHKRAPYLWMALLVSVSSHALSPERAAQYQQASERCRAEAAQRYGTALENERLSGTHPAKWSRSLHGIAVRLTVSGLGMHKKRTCLILDRGGFRFFENHL